MVWDTPTNVEMTKNGSAWKKPHSRQNHFVGFVLKDENILIGSGGITFRSDDHELGRIIAKPYGTAGRFEAVALSSVPKTKRHTGYSRKTRGNNTASGRIIRNGFAASAGSYTSFNGTKTYDCLEYVLHL